MKFRKIFAGFIITAMTMVFTSPIATVALGVDNEMSLYEFINTTENVDASFKYPSLKLSANSSDKVKLPAHTPIIIKCVDTISTKDVVSGSTVNFAVVSDVKDANSNVLILAGTPVTAQITFAKTSGMIGKSGEITVNDFHTTAVDGTYIPLSASVSAQPDDKMTMSVVLSVLICPLFLLMKGDQAQVPAGTTKTAYTISDIYIKPSRV